MYYNAAERIPVPDKCDGCEQACEIANRSIPSERDRVESATGVRVWSTTKYATDRTPEYQDAFRGRIDPAAAQAAAQGYDQDVHRVNAELVNLTDTCPGLQEGQVCGRVVVAATVES